MPEYRVRAGDCIASIAERAGVSVETIWNHPQNEQLRRQRDDPNVLYPGDIVFVPEREPGSFSGACEQRHRFRRLGVPLRLRMRIMQFPEEQDEQQPREAATETRYNRDVSMEDPEPVTSPQEWEPRVNVPFVLNIDGTLIEGRTDGDGYIDLPLPAKARRGELKLEAGTPCEKRLPVRLGRLNPLSELSGIKQRLVNLGFPFDDIETESMTRELEDTLLIFQEMHGLDITGVADSATRDRLRELHGS